MTNCGCFWGVLGAFLRVFEGLLGDLCLVWGVCKWLILLGFGWTGFKSGTCGEGGFAHLADGLALSSTVGHVNINIFMWVSKQSVVSRLDSPVKW